MTAQGGSIPKQFAEVGTYFVTDILHIRPDLTIARDAKYLMNRSLDYVVSEDPEVAMQKYCNRIHPNDAKFIMQSFNTALENRFKAVRRSESDATNHHVEPIQTEQHEEQPRPTKQSRTAASDKDLDDRHTLQNLTTTKEKITLMITIWERLETLKSEAKQHKVPLKMTSGAKSWVSRSLKPAITCVKNHFGNNSDINDTTLAIAMVNSEVTELNLAFSCSPFDCSGHGQCINGTCQCTSGESVQRLCR